MTPSKLSAAQLAGVLREMAALVETEDSFNGSIEYDCMEEGLRPGEFSVTAIYRVGNSMGQGGMRIYGDLT